MLRTLSSLEADQRFKLESSLGEGGFGITYRAFDRDVSHWVAIKIVTLTNTKSWEIVDLLEREAKVLENLDHPSIPAYIDSFIVESEENKSFYLVQEYAPGKTLYQWVQEGYSFRSGEIVKIATQLLQTLAYLQSFSPPVVHRDIKPQNVLRDDDGSIYLVDFGSVQDTYRHTVTGGSTVVGTFGYMAPEQFRGQANPATDLYGLGATLIFLLTGKDPAEIPEKKMRIDFRAVIDTEIFLGRWLDGMISPILEERFENADTALAMLNGDRPLPKPGQSADSRLSIKQDSQTLEISIAPPGFSRRELRWPFLAISAFNIAIGLWLGLLMLLPRVNEYLPAAVPRSLMGLFLGVMSLIAVIGKSGESSWLKLTTEGFKFSSGLWAKPSRRIGRFYLSDEPVCKGSFAKLQLLEMQNPTLHSSAIFVTKGHHRYRLGQGLALHEQEMVMEAIASFLAASTKLSRQEQERILGTDGTSQTHRFSLAYRPNANSGKYNR